MPSTPQARIVETGAVIARYPFDGNWSPCVRYEGELYGVRIGPEFKQAHEAMEFAEELAKKQKDGK